MCSITGGGERLHNVFRLIGSKLWCPWQQKAPTDLQWGKWCLHLFSIAFDPILFILAGNEDMHKILDEFELRPDRMGLIMGKCCLHASSFIFYQIIIKVAGNQDRHKSSVEFDFGPNQTTQFGVTCPWVTNILHFWTWLFLIVYQWSVVVVRCRPHFQTWISLKPVGLSWSNFMCSIIGVGERLIKVLWQIGSKHWFP